MRVRPVLIALTLAGCAGSAADAPKSEDRESERQKYLALAAGGGTPSAAPSDAAPAAEARPGDVWFRTLVAHPEQAADAMKAADEAPASAPDIVAAAAMALGNSTLDASEADLVALALRPSQPPEAVEGLFSYYRWRGGDRQPPAQLPNIKLLDYQNHPDARGRAALAHLGRAVKDPVLVLVLEKLSRDSEMEVRRAVAISLADGAKTKRLDADAQRCLATLGVLVRDADAHVVASSCRSISSYTPPTPLQVQQLMTATNHADFNVRVAALEGLGKFLTKDATNWKPGVVQQMTKLARTDPSSSVRFTAASQLAEIGASLPLVDDLLGDPSVYVRTAAPVALGKSDLVSSMNRLAAVARSDQPLRVRETAVGAFEGKKESAIAKVAVKAALADADVIVVATACGVVAKNGWTEMADVVAEVPARFPGCAGADARESAISALSDLGGEGRRALYSSFLADPNPAVRAAAAKALAVLDKKDPPKDPSRGADLTGELLPGGAPVFEKDVFLIVTTAKGTMKIRLFPDQAPVHCAHVVALARTGFYDGLVWHRVVPDFVIQGGCPRGDGSGNAGVTLSLEPTRIPFERGTLGMPRSDHPDTGGCQLFICHSRAPHLDVHYTAFGKVVEGADVIDRIDVDDKIEHVRVEGVR
jgi:peptidyl-prolyl cis-trans isomerase B (cyclophilin B)